MNENSTFANIVTNPDLADATRPVVTEPGRFVWRLDVVVEAAGLERQRLLNWILRLDRIVGGVVLERRQYSRDQPAGGGASGGGAGPVIVQP